MKMQPRLVSRELYKKFKKLMSKKGGRKNKQTKNTVKACTKKQSQSYGFK